MSKMRITTALVIDFDVDVDDTQGATECTMSNMGKVDDLSRLAVAILDALQADPEHMSFVRSAAELAAHAMKRDIPATVDVWPVAVRGKMGVGNADYLIDLRTVDESAGV